MRNKSNEGFRVKRPKAKKPVVSVDYPDEYYDRIEIAAQERISKDKRSKLTLDDQ